jgi:mannose-6-phosphate isomerase-like protein (cupin superfamily)
MSQPTDRLFLSLPGEGEYLDPSGSLILRVPATATGGAYSVLELTLGPGQGAPLHVHRREDEIFYVLSGECQVSDVHGPRTALPGSVAVFARGTPHAFRNTGAEPCRVAITAVPGGLEHFFVAINEAVAAGQATPERLAAISSEFEIDFLPVAAPPAPA